MTIYENRFEVLKNHLYETVPTPSKIYNIMASLELSQRIAMELCYKASRSKFRSYLKPELEDANFDDPYIRLMPANVWRYFKLNCCIYADRYKEPSPYTKYSAKRMYKPLSHMHLDFIRYLNNWYSSSVFLGTKKDADIASVSGFYIDKGLIGNGRTEEEDIDFILGKADEIAGMYGFKCAEDLLLSELLDPISKKINILPLAS